MASDFFKLDKSKSYTLINKNGVVKLRLNEEFSHELMGTVPGNFVKYGENNARAFKIEDSCVFEMGLLVKTIEIYLEAGDILLKTVDLDVLHPF